MSYMTTRHATSLNLDLALGSRELHLRSHQASIFRQRLHVAQNLYQRNMTAHYGCVNALEFSNGGQYLASGGDDRRVLLWHVDQALANVGEPRVMCGEHASNIFCLGFDTHNSYVFSGGNDDLVIQHDLSTGKSVNIFSHDGPVYGLSVDKTSSNLISVATEDGEILVYDLRVGENDPLTIAKFSAPFNAVEFHPLNGNFLATANAKRGAMLWDIRHHTQPLYQYNFIPESPSCMSVRFNCNGSLLLTLHRRLPPILFSPNSTEPLCTFYHHEYFNSCTMKSCTFAGPEDELVVSGSDNFNMFIWRLDGVDMEQKDQWIDTAPIILSGHRSIVNQVRYNRQRCLLASSGVEKIIKLWSPFAQAGWQGSLLQKSATPYCNRTLHRNATNHVSQDFSARNTDEDAVMLAFFDTLVQRELEVWQTPSASGQSSSESLATSTESDSSSQSEDTPNVSELSWQAHPNRIFYLIAKKRRALLHLALKSASTGGHLPLRVRAKSPVTTANVEQLLGSLLGGSRHSAMQARVSDWLEQTHRLIGDDEMPTTSAEAAARERSRRALWIEEREDQDAPSSTTNSSNKTRTFQMIGSVQASFEQMERKRKLMHLRFAAALKRRRTARRSDRDEDSVIAYESDWLDDDDDDDVEDNGDDGEGEARETEADDTSTNSSSTEQLSEAPSSSSALCCITDQETNNNSQMTTNNNSAVATKPINGLDMPAVYNGESGTAEPAGSSKSKM
ncbi:DDB1- and CUL4-associated factor 5 [Scaptodrosophila lebanonensis]|uniref:DDB1- and CUL4-associated factor 5 n=1 Tax=Drosophila lebanonensis TaxID=7225 RepID=A0A6J2T441_DROLE|nr:DDB1- and CUL4-associated factor 5 [Scaptodrosophila lebanonensis]